MPRNPANLWHDRALALLVAFLSNTLGRLSWRAAQRVGGALGGICWWLLARDRQRSLAHLKIAFPERSAAERSEIARASFRHLGTTLGECLHLLRRDSSALLSRVTFEGWENLDAARAAGRPIVILTGHCGNWELLAGALATHGLPLAAVARSLDEPGLQRLLAGLRARFGTETIERGRDGSARQILGALRKGTALGLLIDQDTDVDGVWVPFFGRLAYTPVGAAKIALKQNAAVLPTFIERLPDGNHRAVVAPPLEFSQGPKGEDAAAAAATATAVMTLAIEAQVRRRPEQWVWMHRRWKRRPPSG